MVAVCSTVPGLMLLLVATLAPVDCFTAQQPPPHALESPPLQTTAYDVAATLVPLAKADELAALLAQHKTVRLEGGDYTAGCARSGTCANLTLTSGVTFPPVRSRAVACSSVYYCTHFGVSRIYHAPPAGMALYGLPNTRVPTVIVQPGSTGIMLSKLQIAGLLHFPAAAQRDGLTPQPTTSHCSFFHISGPHVLFEGAVSDLQFVGLTELGAPQLPTGQPYKVGGIHVAASASVTNSRFVRCMVHAPWPTLSVAVDKQETGVFRGNTVLWENSLGAHSSARSAYVESAYGPV